MLTNKDYCDYDTCVALRELGYPTKMTFVSEQATIEIPINSGLIQLYEAHKWLRKERQMILLPAYLNGANVWICEICYKRERLGFGGYNQTYEEALSEGVKCAVKILKEK